MQTPTHLVLARRLLKHYPKLINDVYLSEEYYGELRPALAATNTWLLFTWIVLLDFVMTLIVPTCNQAFKLDILYLGQDTSERNLFLDL